MAEYEPWEQKIMADNWERDQQPKEPSQPDDRKRFFGVGFTGTREGMTSEQCSAFYQVISELPEFEIEFHHGDCIGADDNAADIFDDWRHEPGEGELRIVCHPPIDATHRAWNKRADETRKPKTHFARNRDIVDESEMLIACPQYMGPITKDTKGGTAYTVNYARKQKKRIVIIRPDGSIETV